MSFDARRTTVPLLACVVICLSIGGCKHVRDFLIPPQSAGGLRARAQRDANWADLVLRNARLPGLDKGAVAVRHGRIVAVGSEREVAKLIGPGTKLRDIRAGWLTPGFVDSHIHLDGMALLRDAVDLRGIRSLDDARSRILKAGELHTFGSWLWAFGASHELMKGLDAAAIEEMRPGLQLWVSAADGHQAVVSESLLQRVPAAARLVAKGKRGRLDAVTARALWRLLPLPSIVRIRPQILETLSGFAKQGVTTVHVMGVTRAFLQVLVDLERSGRLQTRVFVYLDAEAPLVDQYVAEKQARRAPRKPGQAARTPSPLPDDETHKVKVVGIKMWLDGSLGARTAALSQPYADHASAGKLIYDDDDVIATLSRADAAGLQLALHAIGDRAVAQAARAERAVKRSPDAAPLRIEHAQVVAPQTLEQMQGRRILCAVQPLHELADRSFSTARLGTNRAAWAYRAASLAKRCPITIGSDAPIAEAKPWAAARHLVSGKAGISAQEAMTKAAALAALAIDPLSGTPMQIAAGQAADLVLWSAQPKLSDPMPELLLMLVDGETVFSHPELPKAKVAPSLPQ